MRKIVQTNAYKCAAIRVKCNSDQTLLHEVPINAWFKPPPPKKRHCTHNAILRRFRVCVCSFRYPAGNSHAPYFHPWPTPFYNTFPRFLKKNRAIFRGKKKVSNTKSELLFSLRLLYETFLILRRNERDMTKNVYWSTRKVPFITVRF